MTGPGLVCPGVCMSSRSGVAAHHMAVHRKGRRRRGEDTKFLHLDLIVHDFVETGYGGIMISSSLALDKEAPKDVPSS